MTTTQANFRINADTNDQADQIFTLLGITPPQAVNHFYQYVADNVRLPFSVQITLKFKERAHMPNKQQLKVRSWHKADANTAFFVCYEREVDAPSLISAELTGNT